MAIYGTSGVGVRPPPYAEHDRGRLKNAGNGLTVG